MKEVVAYCLKIILRDYYFDFLYWYFFFRKNKVSSKKQKLLIVNHFFEQDIEALKRANRSFEFIILDAYILRSIATQIFPSTVESYAVYNSKEMGPIKRRYRKIIDRFVKKLIKLYGVNAIVTPSDNFFYLREIILSLQKKNIISVVIDKEGTICPAYFIHFADYIKESCPLIADYILVWSERQKKFWTKAGTPAKKITVVGQPRSDFWRQPERWLKKYQLGIKGLRGDSKLFIFFTYDPWAYTPDYIIEQGEMHWDTLRNDTHKVIFNFSQAHPEVKMIMKAHPQQRDTNDIQKEIQEQKLQNVFLTTGPSISNHLIVNADCIIGFQSTALIEAMMTEKPIIYTFWGEAKEKWSEDLIPLHKTTGIRTANSPKELKEYMEKSLQGISLSSQEKQERKIFREEYFYKVDGHCAERTLMVIKKLITEK